MLVPDQSGGVRDSSQPCCSFDFLAVRLLLALQGSLQVLLLLAWDLLPLVGEEALEGVRPCLRNHRFELSVPTWAASQGSFPGENQRAPG